MSSATASGSFPPGTIFFHQPNGGNKLCRKVVVDVRGDNLICLHVTTNGGNATKKLNRARQSEHAIIYTGSKPPKPPRDERHLRKTAIRATIVRKPYVLHELSRVDYGTEVPVEHTEELGHLGQVKSVGILLEEWKKVRGDAESSVQEVDPVEADNAAGDHTSQSRSSSAPVGRRGTGSETEADTEERVPTPQQAVVRPDSSPPGTRAEQSIANLKPKEVIVKDGRMVRLSKNQRPKRLEPDTSSNEVSKPPRTVRQRTAPERKSISALPTQQARRPLQGLKSRAQNNSLSPGMIVRPDILTETIEAAVSRAMAERDSNKQKEASIEEVIKQTGIHSQFNNVVEVRPMFNGPPPPYDVMDFEEDSQPPIRQRRTEEPEPSAWPGRTADCSSSDAPTPNVLPRAPTPPPREMETPDQENCEGSDASEYESEYEHQPNDLQMPEWEAQQAFNTYLKPHQISTGPGSSSSRAESSRRDTLFLFFNCNRQHRALKGRLDTGADDNFISPRAARAVAHSYHRYRGNPIEVANGVIQMPEWLVFTYWGIKNAKNTFWHNSFVVFNNLPCDVIIGHETIKKNGILHANPKYSGCFLLRFTSSEGKKAKERQEEERRRRQEHNRQIAAQQNMQTYQELEQEYANEMHAQQGYAGQNGQ